MRKQGEIICYKYLVSPEESFEGFATIVGVASTEQVLIGVTYILKDLSGNIPNNTYPYTHFALPEIFINQNVV